jgi:hypothetical protein
MQVRRVVTGHGLDGEAVFVEDKVLTPITSELLPGYEFHQIWGYDTPPKFPDDGSMPQYSEYFPPLGGVRCGLYTLPAGNPEAPSELDVREALRVLNIDLPGLFSYHERGGTGMHKTPTIDFELVLSGQVTLELDDGAITVLTPGDVVVQNGTRHRWLNMGEQPATFILFLSGVQHDDPTNG